MPLYDFTCQACRRTFEALVRPGHAPACPVCASTDLERALPVVAVKTAERSKAFARANRHKYAVQGHQESMAREREAARHRREDH